MLSSEREVLENILDRASGQLQQDRANFSWPGYSLSASEIESMVKPIFR
jgi:hypothetical protein